MVLRLKFAKKFYRKLRTDYYAWFRYAWNKHGYDKWRKKNPRRPVRPGERPSMNWWQWDQFNKMRNLYMNNPKTLYRTFFKGKGKMRPFIQFLGKRLKSARVKGNWGEKLTSLIGRPNRYSLLSKYETRVLWDPKPLNWKEHHLEKWHKYHLPEMLPPTLEVHTEVTNRKPTKIRKSRLINPQRWWTSIRKIKKSLKKVRQRRPRLLQRHHRRDIYAKPWWMQKKKFRSIADAPKVKIRHYLRSRVFRRTFFVKAWRPQHLRKTMFNQFVNQVKHVHRNDEAYYGFKVGKLFINCKPNNTFLTLTTRNPGMILYTVNAGQVGYTGPKRGTTSAREEVAAEMARYATEANVRVVDIYTKLFGKVFWYLMKGFIENKLHVRSFVLKKLKGHGYIRPKKERRL